MSEEEKYIVISSDRYYLIEGYYTKERAVAVAKAIFESVKHENPRIFKIEKEINWKEQKEENNEEKKENNVLNFRYDIFD